eukprot:m.483420 g.483420  ORF g.483420 m.483420 type:complete len:512 (-) comp22936_c0_seq1:119-1654(-)
MDAKDVLVQVKAGVSSSLDLAKTLGQDHQKVVGAIKSLQVYDNLINVTPQSTEHYSLKEEGEQCVAQGSYEYRVYQLVPDAGINFKDLEALEAYKEVGKIGYKQCMAQKLLARGKDGIITKNAKLLQDTTKDLLVEVQQGRAASIDAKVLQGLIKRKLVEKTTIKYFEVSPGSDFSLEPKKKDSDLTADMLADGSWRERSFKKLNLMCEGPAMASGVLHPTLKVRAQYRQIFLEMGFEEMPTNQWIESSFWNFDTLFQPQQHPARDAHDTFFLSDPATTTDFPREYLERVKAVHERGGYGSQGYRYDWSEVEAGKNILRTHTTAVSARMLYKLAQQKTFKPAKYFSIDRVFRNETLDATHLAEFHQIEGLIADRNLTLADLMGVLGTFFRRLGIPDLRFKPAYNPYTEPSMEIFSYHPGLDKVVEIGNSGVFRPEMLLPMGLPDDVVVIAWGLSLERPTMIKYGYDNIRDLAGPKVSLSKAREQPICRMPPPLDEEEDAVPEQPRVQTATV